MNILRQITGTQEEKLDQLKHIGLMNEELNYFYNSMEETLKKTYKFKKSLKEFNDASLELFNQPIQYSAEHEAFLTDPELIETQPEEAREVIRNLYQPLRAGGAEEFQKQMNFVDEEITLAVLSKGQSWVDQFMASKVQIKRLEGPPNIVKLVNQITIIREQKQNQQQQQNSPAVQAQLENDFKQYQGQLDKKLEQAFELDQKLQKLTIDSTRIPSIIKRFTQILSQRFLEANQVTFKNRPSQVDIGYDVEQGIEYTPGVYRKDAWMTQ